MEPNRRRSMNDIIVPTRDLVRRPSYAPEVRPDIAPEPAQRAAQTSDTGPGAVRIEENPFFTKQPAVPQVSRSPRPATPSSGGGSSRGWLWAVAVIALIGAGVAIISLFARATVTITPVSQASLIDQEFTAVKEGEGLTFQFMTLTEEKSKDVEATVEKKIDRKASGMVVIYNAYSAASQRLIKNTRLESPDHKIFRINDSVVVPGAKVVKGSVVEPGTVEAVVYADAPGKEYNIGLGDFTIPGFKGDPRYDKFTARSKADSPLAGGFSGTVKVPTDEAVVAAQNALKDDLKATVVEKARAEIPANNSFFPGSVVVKFEEVPQDLSVDAKLTVTMRATISVFFFDTKRLTEELAGAAGIKENGAGVTIINMSALSFAFVDPVDKVVLADITQIRFHITGNTTFVSTVDATKIAHDIAGKNKGDFSGIITTEGGVKKADAVVRPFWQTKFPDDPSKISVNVTPGE